MPFKDIDVNVPCMNCKGQKGRWTGPRVIRDTDGNETYFPTTWEECPVCQGRGTRVRRKHIWQDTMPEETM